MQSFVRTIVPALLVSAAFALLSQTAGVRRLELLGFDALSIITTPASIDAPIVIVGIDEPSFAELDRPWPWPRGLHARLVDRLKAAGAAVVAFDVLFAEPSDDEQDALLADAIRRAGNVVLASDIVFQESGQFRMAMPVLPIPELRKAGALPGLAGIRTDPDLVVRAIPKQEDAFWRQIVRAYHDATHATPRHGPAEDRRTLARYLGPEHSLRYVSYYQALDPDSFLPPGIFAGKIVIVGHDIKVSLGPVSARSDAFATPYSALSGFLTPGVEIQATFVANGLTGAALRETSRGSTAGLIFLAVLLMGVVVREWQALRGMLVALAVMAAAAGLSVWLFAEKGVWLPVVSALLAVATMYVVQVAMAFLRERRKRRQIEMAFRYYVSPDIVAEMTAHPERLVLGGARRDITVMFTDLAGFTSVSETVSPERVSTLLNDYLTHMTGIILARGGTVDKFIGDAIMAFWGAPLPDSDQALHACQAAYEMQNELSRLRESYKARGLPELHMRIGVHSGSAVVGNMGSSDRFDYTAVGDTINLASRLEGINKLYGTEILISKDTARQLGDNIPLRYVDRVIVKGKTRSIEIYTICEDSEINRLGEVAFSLYAQQRWDDATDAYRALLAQHPGDTIAGVFLDRIDRFRGAPPQSDWDGSMALEKL